VIDVQHTDTAVLAERALPHPQGAPLLMRRVSRKPDSTLPDAETWNALLGAPPLTAAELSALSAMARPRFIPQGGVVFSQDGPARSLVFVCDGDAALGWCGADGQFRIERPVRGPGWLDQSAAWIDAAHAIDARAVTSLVVVELPREEVQALVLTHPALARRLIASLAREAHALTVNTHGLMHKDAPSRFAQWLLQRCRLLPDETGGGVVRLGERKRDIAAQLAVTPETLSRLMRSLTRQGLISVAGYTVNVTDVDGLRRVADGV
jgi:CRP-like cAMP-binding protein